MSTPAEARPRAAEFAEALPFELDPFQVEALEAVEGEESVLVAAPTGSGKTVVAEFACWLARRTGGKCFYTTPVKALSNQKFQDLVAEHGSEAVGLLTGDNTINGEAQLVVMTTEVLRNMLYEGSETLRGLRWVVFDEVHYLQDPFRGAVWEEALIHLPPEVRVVCLSATVSNDEEFGEWLRTVRGTTRVIVERQRPVELRNLVMVGEELYPLLVEPSPDGRGAKGADSPRHATSGGRVNAELERAWARGAAQAERFGHKAASKKRRPNDRIYTPTRVELAEVLEREKMLPAICFIFSRIGCDKAAEACIHAGTSLTNRHEAEEIVEVAETRAAEIDPKDLRALRFGTFLEGLRRGVAPHHAGMIPIFKETVEELFRRGLVKLVFATETLALGINMPAKTVAIERLTKFTGEKHELLTPTDYTQLTGRAGRRGMDELGYGVVLYSPWVGLDDVAGLATRKAYELTSSFRPSYNMAVNLVRTHDREGASQVLNLSFAQFAADRSIVRSERRLRERQQEAEELWGKVRCDEGDVLEYLELREKAEEGLRAERGSPEVQEAFGALGRGDVVFGDKLGRALVCEQPRRAKKGEPKVTVMTLDRKLRRVTPRDFRTPPVPVARMHVKGNSWRSPKVRKHLARELRGLEVERPERLPGPKQAKELRDAYEAHPVHGCPEMEEHLHWARPYLKAVRSAERLRRRMGQQRGSLSRTFERVLGVLEELGYVEDWRLTEKGKLLARVYSQADLLVVECLQRGWLLGLDSVELPAVLSLFVYEPRGREETESAPTPHLSRYHRRIADLASSLKATEERHSLDLLKEPEGGFMTTIAAWAAGASLEEILVEKELSAGDFVRSAKQVLDLLQQLRQVVDQPELAEALDASVACINRGVVGYTSV